MKIILATHKSGKHQFMLKMDGRKNDEYSVQLLKEYIEEKNSRPSHSAKYPLKDWEIQVFIEGLGHDAGKAFRKSISQYHI